MLKKQMLKTALSIMLIPTLLTLQGCGNSGTNEFEQLAYYGDPEAEADWKHQQELKSQGLQVVGKMQEGEVVVKEGDQANVWLRDDKTHNLYPVRPVDGSWIMTNSGLLQRSLDKQNARDKKKQDAYGQDADEGGDGGGGD